MAKFSLRRPETQASSAMICALVSLVCLLGLAVLVFRNFHAETLSVMYSSRSLRMPAILVAAMLSGTLALLGFGFGWSSAGNRRNFRNRQSWLGFFIGGFGMCATVVLFALFYLWKESVIR